MVTAGPYQVLRAESGATLVVKSGRRRAPEQTVTLEYCEAPASGTWADIAKNHLQEIAGGTVTVRYQRHGLLRNPTIIGPDGEPQITNEAFADLEAEITEARGPLTGTVIGESGIVTNLAMIEGGYVRCSKDAPKEWQKVGALAEKKKLGLWSEKVR